MTSIMFFLFFVPILGFVLLNLNFFLAPHRPYKEKKTPFECGYHSFTTQNRTPFTISFYIFAMLFLLFDIEITTVFPFVVSSNFNDSYGFSVVIIFILILTLGFVFELGKNALKIDTKQDKSSLESMPMVSDLFQRREEVGFAIHGQHGGFGCIEDPVMLANAERHLAPYIKHRFKDN